jgi:hypothetical protein
VHRQACESSSPVTRSSFAADRARRTLDRLLPSHGPTPVIAHDVPPGSTEPLAAGELNVAQDAQQASRDELDGIKSMVRSGCRRYWS